MAIRSSEIFNKEEMDLYLQVINEVAYQYNQEKRKMEVRDTYGKAFLQIMNLWRRRQKKIVMAKRFASIAANSIGHHQ